MVGKSDAYLVTILGIQGPERTSGLFPDLNRHHPDPSADDWTFGLL